MGGAPRWVGAVPGGTGLWLGVDLAADGTAPMLLVAVRHDGRFNLADCIEALGNQCRAAADAAPATKAEYLAYSARLAEAADYYLDLAARHNAGHPERTQP
jgi:hypothetical protein